MLAHLNYAWPQQRGGSETATHRVLAWLVSRGHEVRAVVTQHNAVTTDGVRYERLGQRLWADWWQWADVAIAHQASSTQAAALGALHGRAVVHWAHNWHWFDMHPTLAAERASTDVVLWNSHALAAAQGSRWPGRQGVLHPPVWPSEWTQDEPGDAVVQINLSNLKGGAMFYDLARELPEIPFVGVMGGWGRQRDALGHEWLMRDAPRPLRRYAPPNVTLIEPTTDMRSVYRRARVVIMPTQRVSDDQTGESYGLVAVEATCAGLPVIATDSPGMREALDGAGVLLDPNDFDSWAHHVDRLMGAESAYTEACAAAQARALTVDPTPELEALEALLGDLVSCAS